VRRGDNFEQAMADGKANALRNRDRGGSSVRVFKTARAMHARRGDRGRWEHRLDVARSHWISVGEQAIEDLLFAVRGDDMLGFEL